MADVKINLEATHKEFLAAITAASKATTTLLAELGKLSDAHTKTGTAANKHAAATNQATDAMKRSGQASHSAASSQNVVVAGITATVAAWFLLIGVLSKVKDAMEATVKSAIKNIDDFKAGTIGTAAAITNLTNRSLQFGASWHDVFLRNLKETQIVFVELENLSARYFASGADLQLAYNALAQRGVILRKTELEQLAQLTDLILLLTQGQQSSIQVQEEIRSLINGTIRPTAQLAQLIKSFGLNVKDVAAEIKATQSLRPLEGILIGAQQATTEIQKTFRAATNGLEVILRQLGRAGGDAFYTQIVGAVQRFTQFLKDNEPQIVRIFSIIGKLTADVIIWFEKLAEEIIRAPDKIHNFVDAWINVIAVLQATIATAFNLLKVFGLLARDLPLLFGVLAKGFLPGAGFGPLKAFGEAFKILQKDMESLRMGDPYLMVKNLAAGMHKAVNEALGSLKKLREAESEGFQPTSQRFKPSEEEKVRRSKLTSAAEEATIRRAASERVLSNITTAGEIDRAIVQLRRNLVFIEDGFEVMSNGVLGSLRTVAGDVQKFLGENTVSVARGVATDITQLYRTIAETVKRTFAGTAGNLEAQLAAVEQGIASFTAQSEDTMRERVRVEVGPETIDRKMQLEDAEHDFQVIKDALEKEIARAEKFFTFATGKRGGQETGVDPEGLRNDIKKTGEEISVTTARIVEMETELRLLGAEAKVTGQDVNVFLLERGAKEKQEELAGHSNALKLLKKEYETLTEIQAANGKGLDTLVKKYQVDVEALRGSAFGQLDTAQGALNHARVNARLQDTIAREDELRLINKSLQDIETERNKLLNERIRILQQVQTLQANIAKGILESAGVASKLKVSAAEGQPRTDLQIARAPVEKQRIEFEAGIAERQAGIDQLLSVAKVLFAVDEDRSNAMAEQAFRSQELLNAVKAEGEAAIIAARLTADLAASLTALGTAIDSTLTTLADALLNSFEGKKTDFIRAFKDITDNLFKDSLKDVFSSIKTSLTTGFKDLVGSIAPSMASTLGPAFLAGFALIASFVLGQLLSGNEASATPGGATVGIQSSEQVRGLIGGETQIPIGLVGESLQNALVPTNQLLQRIAFGVERISFGGISPAVIESVISQSISESLQIQLASH